MVWFHLSPWVRYFSSLSTQVQISACEIICNLWCADEISPWTQGGRHSVAVQWNNGSWVHWPLELHQRASSKTWPIHFPRKGPGRPRQPKSHWGPVPPPPPAVSLCKGKAGERRYTDVINCPKPLFWQFVSNVTTFTKPPTHQPLPGTPESTHRGATPSSGGLPASPLHTESDNQLQHSQGHHLRLFRLLWLFCLVLGLDVKCKDSFLPGEFTPWTICWEQRSCLLANPVYRIDTLSTCPCL